MSALYSPRLDPEDEALLFWLLVLGAILLAWWIK